MSRWLFVTGKLAAPALKRLLSELAPRAGFAYDVAVLPITAVSLATTDWIARHLDVPADIDSILLPGLCAGNLEPVKGLTNAQVFRGPNDFRDLPDYFGIKNATSYGGYDIEILAEINHVPRMTRHEIVEQALTLKNQGADVIDLGCDPGSVWSDAGDAVKALRDLGLRVSIDSFNRVEVEAAVRAGAELVLSVNRSNREAARDWGCEVVAVPTVTADLGDLDQTIEYLASKKVPFRIDPVIEPIGMGFAESLGRYLEVRRRYPDAEIMMGIGNLTELTDVDSAGVNVVLLGFCQEVGIRSVLTTQVINWCRSCVREIDLARRLVYHAWTQRVLPKHVEPGLVMLRDPKLHEFGAETLKEWANSVRDRNFRLIAERGRIHVINDKIFAQGTDPFELFKQMQERENIDPAHAFYLGFEMAKALTALKLGKNYVQDQPLRWGFLSDDES
ncbi:MAG: dihydropteroate synthase [Gemmatales bacterium]|nr:MAG: dihydropteroate synthase [Gemmatales bacterium]